MMDEKSVFGRALNRAPAAQHQAYYKTYGIAAPKETHRRTATCSEVDCANRAKGWKTVLDVSQGAHQRTANWIRLQSGKAFTYTQAGSIVTFVFPAGQDCFQQHTVSLERPQLFLVMGGDHRGNPLELPTRLHSSGDDWVDDFANHQDKIATVQQRG